MQRLFAFRTLQKLFFNWLRLVSVLVKYAVSYRLVWLILYSSLRKPDLITASNKVTQRAQTSAKANLVLIGVRMTSKIQCLKIHLC